MTAAKHVLLTDPSSASQHMRLQTIASVRAALGNVPSGATKAGG